MSTPEDPTENAGPAEESAFARETPAHVDPDDPQPEVSEETLDTDEFAGGGPAGA